MRWKYKSGDWRKSWHKYFAWFPTLVECPHGGALWVWLEPIQRKGTFWSNIYDCGWDWDYKLPDYDIANMYFFPRFKPWPWKNVEDAHKQIDTEPVFAHNRAFFHTWLDQM